MDWIGLILIALGLAMDAFAVSVTNGVCTRRLSLFHTLRMALFFGLFQAAMPIIGYFLGSAFSTLITSASHWIAFALLAFIGGKMLFEAIRTKKPEAEARETDGHPPSLRTLLFLSLATSIDALAVGMSFAMIETRIWVAALLIGCITFALSSFGVLLGKRLGKLIGRNAEIFGGLILIGIGIKILVEGLLG